MDESNVSDVVEIDWEPIKASYLTGKLKPKQLIAKYGVDAVLLKRRIEQENWPRKRRKLMVQTENRITNRTLSKADMWVSSQHDRAIRFRDKIMESMDSTHGPIDPQALDQLTKAEMRVDDMGRRALGLVDPKALDITSGGMPLGAFGAALDKIKGMVDRGEVRVEDLDIDRLSASEIVKDGED